MTRLSFNSVSRTHVKTNWPDQIYIWQMPLYLVKNVVCQINLVPFTNKTSGAMRRITWRLHAYNSSTFGQNLFCLVNKWADLTLSWPIFGTIFIPSCAKSTLSLFSHRFTSKTTLNHHSPTLVTKSLGNTLATYLKCRYATQSITLK